MPLEIEFLWRRRRILGGDLGQKLLSLIVGDTRFDKGFGRRLEHGEPIGRRREVSVGLVLALPQGDDRVHRGQAAMAGRGLAVEVDKDVFAAVPSLVEDPIIPTHTTDGSGRPDTGIMAMMSEHHDLPDLDKVQYVDSPVDGLPARVVGDWSEDKHYYLGHFIDIFSTGMHKKWASRAYIDLFAGPGVCMFRQTGKITEGSPLLALKTAHPFTQYFFSDLDPIAVAALKKRCQPFASKMQIEIAQKDCNVVAAEVASKIKPGTLCLAFLDPTNLALKFSAIMALTKDKAMDLVIHFPHGTTIKRNIEKFYAKDKSTMDDFFGGVEWRTIYEKNPKNLTGELLDLYKTKLAGIGYTMAPDQAVLIKNSKNVPLYALLFATKHPKGSDFWKKIKQVESRGQRELPGL